jgi:hypothetical protein
MRSRPPTMIALNTASCESITNLMSCAPAFFKERVECVPPLWSDYVTADMGELPDGWAGGGDDRHAALAVACPTIAEDVAGCEAGKLFMCLRLTRKCDWHESSRTKPLFGDMHHQLE